MGACRLLGIILIAAAASLAASASPGKSLGSGGKEVGLVLVPVEQRPARPEDVPFRRPPPRARERREVPDGHKKYQRLAHSVHVQSDIRYRSVCSSAEAALPCTVSPKVTLVSLLLCCCLSSSHVVNVFRFLRMIPFL